MLPVPIFVGDVCDVEKVVGIGEFKYVMEATPSPVRVAFTKEVLVMLPR